MRITRRWSKGLAGLALAAGLSGPALAHDDGRAWTGEVRPGLSLGLNGTYFDPERGDGVWSPGALLRLHFGQIWAIEGAADWRRDRIGVGDAYQVDTYPIQASLLAYLLPHSPITPYLLGGFGWYMTDVNGPGIDETSDRVGPHAGGGLQLFLGRSLSLDASYRYIWIEDFASADARLEEKRFNDRGHMIKAGLNFHF